MRWYADLKIRSKLVIAFGVVLLVAVTLGAVGTYNLRQSELAAQELDEGYLTPFVDLGDLAVAFGNVRVAVRNVVTAQDEANRRTFQNEIAPLTHVIDSLAAKAGAAISSAEIQSQLAAFIAARNAYVPIRDRVLNLAAAGQSADALALLQSDGARAEGAVVEALTTVKAHMEVEKTGLMAGNKARVAAATRWMLVLLLLGTVLGMGIAWAVSNYLGRSLTTVAARVEKLRSLCITNLQQGLDALANGNLDATAEYGTPKLTIDTRDEIGDVSRSVNGIIDKAVEAVHAFGRTSATLRQVVASTNALIAAARDGRLGERADASAFEGGYRTMVDGTNAMLEQVVQPLRECTDVLSRVAERDLTARVQGAYRNDLDALKIAINATVENLQFALSEIASGSAQVAVASGQIARGSQALAQGSSEQASSVEEISASLEELSSMAKRNAASAKSARLQADEARRSAEVGVERMNGLSTAIERIKQSSDATAKIVKTIDEIAFQTNLLALNAAVEAARAGDSGRGFRGGGGRSEESRDSFGSSSEGYGCID